MLGTLESREWVGTFGLDFNNGDNLRVFGTDTFEFLARPFRIDPTVTIPPGAYSFATASARYTLGAQRRFAATVGIDQGASMTETRPRSPSAEGVSPSRTRFRCSPASR